MTAFGLGTVVTHESIPAAEQAKWAEENGFDSIWIGEHSHIPTIRKTPFYNGGELPDFYKKFMDPFIGLTAAAAATKKIKLGTSIIQVPEHNPISLAKTIATLDHISGGRVRLGIGAGWNEEELANHGVSMKDRWAYTRESILAMKEIWSKDEAEYHGKLINFDPIWSWPKPAQKGGVPILMGAASKWSPRRMAEYCEGWLCGDVEGHTEQCMSELKEEMKKAGRTMESFDLSVMHFYRNDEKAEKRIRELIGMGFQRIVLSLNPTAPEKQWPWLERLANFRKKFA